MNVTSRPRASRPSRSPRARRAAPTLLVLALVGLAGCGSEAEALYGDDAAGPTAATPTPTPSEPPTVGTYPEFGPRDYDYTLQVSCYCADNAPIRISVRDDEVVSAVYVGPRAREAGLRGEEAPDYRRLTIDDVIAAANDTGAARVDVVWPQGQDHPDSVYVDQDERMADEELGYAVSDVDVVEQVED
ncbi:DUF6174 domain-containing protein [Nocardioides sp.]|uniref:DUF6174 domain-containing protein n=1 Tax=Nocardioides sp. TaxID=35761 RepID=UPI003513A3F2